LFDNYEQYTVHANSTNLRIQQMIMKNSSRHKYSIPEANLIGQMRNGAAEQGLKMHRTALYLGGKTTVLSFCRTKWMKQYKSKNLPHQKVQLAYQYKYKWDWATEAPKPHPPVGSLPSEALGYGGGLTDPPEHAPRCLSPLLLPRC